MMLKKWISVHQNSEEQEICNEEKNMFWEQRNNIKLSWKTVK